MDEKIYRTLQKILLDNEAHGVLEKKAATGLFGHELASGGIGYFVVKTPTDRGMLAEYVTDLPLSATIQSFSNPVYDAESGTPCPLRNRYLGEPVAGFLTVLKDPDISDEGAELTSVKYGAKSKAGAESGTSWFYLPAGVTILFKYTSHAASNNIVTRVNVRLVDYLKKEYRQQL